MTKDEAVEIIMSVVKIEHEGGLDGDYQILQALGRIKDIAIKELARLKGSSFLIAKLLGRFDRAPIKRSPRRKVKKMTKNKLNKHLFKLLKLGYFRLSSQNFGLLLVLIEWAQLIDKRKFSLPVADIAVDSRISQLSVEWGLETLEKFGFLRYSISGSRVTIYFGGGDVGGGDE